MIQSHLIASHTGTLVYQDSSTDEMPVAVVEKGSWLGVVERRGDWIRIVGIECEGWVMASDVEELPPMGLRAVWTPGKPIEYMHLPKAG